MTCYERVHSADTQTLRRPIQNEKAVAEDASEDEGDVSDEDGFSDDGDRGIMEAPPRNTNTKVTGKRLKLA